MSGQTTTVSGPSVELVVAVAENDVIGRGNALPWRLSADLRRFKALTLGKPILMGRKTYESIGKALPGRDNLVLTRARAFMPADCRVFHTLAEVRRTLAAEPLLLVIGGAQIYEQCLPFAQRIHLTQVHTVVGDGDTFFSGWRAPGWVETFRERHTADASNSIDYSFVTLERPHPRSAAADA
jgi:dihydrofolate reductase